MLEQLGYEVVPSTSSIEALEAFRAMPQRFDLVITDPPYLVNYKDRSGRSIMNDDNAGWLQPAFSEIYRVLKNDSFCISFYGWSEVDKFMTTWKDVGFKPVGHIVWHKQQPCGEDRGDWHGFEYLRGKHRYDRQS